MNNLVKILVYIIRNYPFKRELSKARLTKIVYLIDWEYVKKTGHQLTNIQWYYDNYGPFVWDIIDSVKENNHYFNISSEKTYMGNEKTLVSLNKEYEYNLKINPTEKEIIDLVINQTMKFGWNDFINYVYDTPPVKNSKRYTYLDLKKFNQ